MAITADAQALRDLVQLIRKALPAHKELTQLRSDEQLGLVEFTWHSQVFVAKPPCEVLELIGHGSKLTATAMLVQAVLGCKWQHATAVQEVIQAIHAAEDLMPNNSERGIALLETAKSGLEHLAEDPGQWFHHSSEIHPVAVSRAW